MNTVTTPEEVTDEVVTREPASLTYYYKQGEKVVQKTINEITPGMYSIDFYLDSTKLRTSRLTGGIVVMMMRADFEHDEVVIDSKGKALTSYSYYRTHLETNNQNEEILIGIDDEGKVVIDLVNSAFFS